jgi:heme oxygenase (biliverdin-IX-beta and delta-forming)
MVVSMEARFATLHDRLRRRTRALHERVEPSMALGERLASIHAYGALLHRLLGLYRPVERQLSVLDWTRLEVDFPRRCKTGWLESDLLDIGCSPAALRAMPLCSVPPLPDGATALGWLYVLEGATLGGRVILSQAERRLGIRPDWGGRFFAGYGREVGPMWRECRAALNRIEPQSRTADAVEAGAVAMFELFESWLIDGDFGGEAAAAGRVVTFSPAFAGAACRRACGPRWRAPRRRR